MAAPISVSTVPASAAAMPAAADSQSTTVPAPVSSSTDASKTSTAASMADADRDQILKQALAKVTTSGVKREKPSSGSRQTSNRVALSSTARNVQEKHRCWSCFGGLRPVRMVLILGIAY
ncbi:MAG: hypothetical protein JSS22_03415 [Proteobacteria bacterium]|nr:hypothetical protein [Pseudomonadota bacterium]